MTALNEGVAINGEVLQYTFPAAGLPPGTYKAFAALVRPGALADNTFNNRDLVSLSVADVVYAP